MMTPLFSRYVAPARARPQIWRLILGSLVIVAIYLLFIVALFAAAGLVLGGDRAARLAGQIAEPSTPLSVFLLLLSFPGAALGTFLATRLVHKTSPATLFGPATACLRDFVTAAIAGLVVTLVYMLIWSFWFDAVPNLDPVTWLKYLPLVLLGLLIQTGAEELVFRAYLPQQLAARFKSPWVWMFLPAAAFGALHYDPATAGSNTWLIVFATGLFGLAASDLTRITGNLGAAWGFHFMNNIAAIALLSMDGTITGVALYRTPYGAADTSILPGLLAVDIAATVLIWALLRRILRR